jgi:hypothetical protein
MNICYLDTAGFELPTPIHKYYEEFISKLKD